MGTLHQVLFVICPEVSSLRLSAEHRATRQGPGERQVPWSASSVGGVRGPWARPARTGSRVRRPICCLSEKRPEANQPAGRGQREAAASGQRDTQKRPGQERPPPHRLEKEAFRQGHSDRDEEPVFDETAARAAEILELLEGLRAFRQRIVDDAQSMAKQIKTPKEQVEKSLANHPDICKIDASIRRLEAELKAISDNE
jgi:hypothetical protein